MRITNNSPPVRVDLFPWQLFEAFSEFSLCL
jgi:hypothetical protein